MTDPSAQHDWTDDRLPKSGVHDPDCKWLCDVKEHICTRTDHAPCRLCGSDEEVQP